MNYYQKTIERLTWFDDNITPTKKALAELSEKMQAEIYNEGGDGFIMPFIPVALTKDGKVFLPHRLKDIKELLNK
jgi:hypothetical protein